MENKTVLVKKLISENFDSIDNKEYLCYDTEGNEVYGKISFDESGNFWCDSEKVIYFFEEEIIYQVSAFEKKYIEDAVKYLKEFDRIISDIGSISSTSHIHNKLKLALSQLQMI